MSNPLKERWPRLTVTLTKFTEPEICRNCGEPADDLWQECDDHDKPEYRWLWLCGKCGDKIIEPHPRLYEHTHYYAPAPGSMRVCKGCPHRNAPESTCVCPAAKANGGKGILIQAYASMRGFIGGRPFTHYSLPPSACTGKNPTPFDPK